MYKHVLIPVDAASDSLEIQLGFELAHKLGATVTVVHVIKKPSEAKREQGKRQLESWADFARTLGVPVSTQLSLGADIADDIVRVARDVSADLVYMPTHGREGMNRLLLGSVAERVTRLSPIPVMLMRLTAPTVPLHFEHLLMPVDGGPVAQLALQQASELAKLLRAKLTVLHVIPDPPIPISEMGGAYNSFDLPALRSELEREGALIVRKAVKSVPTYPVHNQLVHASGEAISSVINQQAALLGADLIVLGTHGRAGLNRLLLGSVAEAVAHHARVPVLLIAPAQRGEDWQNAQLMQLATELKTKGASNQPSNQH